MAMEFARWSVRYQFNPDRFSSHSRILSILRALPPGSGILDVGTATGYLGQQLTGSGYHMTGIERDADIAQIAAPYYDEMIIADLETGGLVFDRTFDAIVLADVLEHLRQPRAILRTLRQHLSARGRFVLSVPNVANLYVRLSLLAGRFEYAEKGILDEDHLRFFTLKSLHALVDAAGLRTEQLFVTPVPLPVIFPGTREGASLHVVHRANVALTRAWKRLFGYQFVLVASPRS